MRSPHPLLLRLSKTLFSLFFEYPRRDSAIFARGDLFSRMQLEMSAANFSRTRTWRDISSLFRAHQRGADEPMSELSYPVTFARCFMRKLQLRQGVQRYSSFASQKHLCAPRVYTTAALSNRDGNYKTSDLSPVALSA